MVFFKGDKYESDDASDAPFLPGYPVDKRSNRVTVLSTVAAIISCLAGSVVLLCCGFALGRSTVSLKLSPNYQPTDYANTLGEFNSNTENLIPVQVLITSTAAEGKDFTYRPVRFNGSFFHRSIYGGKPNPQLDAAWRRFTDAGTGEYCPRSHVLDLHQTADGNDQRLCLEICQCLPFPNPQQRVQHLMTSRQLSGGKTGQSRATWLA